MYNSKAWCRSLNVKRNSQNTVYVRSVLSLLGRKESNLHILTFLLFLLLQFITYFASSIVHVLNWNKLMKRNSQSYVSFNPPYLIIYITWTRNPYNIFLRKGVLPPWRRQTDQQRSVLSYIYYTARFLLTCYMGLILRSTAVMPLLKSNCKSHYHWHWGYYEGTLQLLHE